MVFSKIIGQSKAVKLLSRALAGDRLAHGYLFTGPDGVGKTSIAMALAAYQFCQASEDARPCGRCGGCMKFASGNHPDFLNIRPDGAAIKIDQVRELKKDLRFSPFESGMRIVILEDVQTMRREAANSLLKILEEPPPDNLLLLIASESEPILPTIISRCQVISFAPLTMDQAATVISRLNPQLDSKEAHTLAVLTSGCPGQVEVLHSEEVLELRNDCIQALLTGSQADAGSVELALDLAGRVADLKGGLDTFFDLLAIFFKENMVAILCDGEGSGDGEVDAARESWNLQQLSDMVKAVDSARRGLARNCNRGLVCEVLMLELFAR
ncbi:MAG: DNA polymerase III subunit delta' [Thermodesulfobacteriota bacterium]|nr:DNA polymerase III subunit delta' [Thermodesulfobacteriota bacterium]